MTKLPSPSSLGFGWRSHRAVWRWFGAFNRDPSLVGRYAWKPTPGQAARARFVFVFHWILRALLAVPLAMGVVWLAQWSGAPWGREVVVGGCAAAIYLLLYGFIALMIGSVGRWHYKPLVVLRFLWWVICVTSGLSLIDTFEIWGPIAVGDKILLKGLWFGFMFGFILANAGDDRLGVVSALYLSLLMGFSAGIWPKPQAWLGMARGPVFSPASAYVEPSPSSSASTAWIIGGGCWRFLW